MVNPYSMIRSALRRAWLRFPARSEALKKARRVYNGPNNRQKWEYKCKMCKKWFMQKEVQVDHIKPCGTFKEEKDWATFGPTLFCDTDNLQILCKPCHVIKGAEDRRRAKK